MFNIFKVKIKKNTEILALVLLLIVTIISTTYYNYSKKKINLNFKNTINNIYLKKTVEHILDNLEPKFKKVQHKISPGETFDNILEKYSIEKKEIEEINKTHGPEPLEDNFTINWLLTNLKKKKRNIKALLLDQSFISGLGNIYVDESLWESGIHPNSTSCSIPKSKILKLHNSIQNILREAIKQLGTTFINFSFLNGQSGNYSNELKIFGKQGQACINCGSIIKKIKVAGRGTHICAKCQKTHRPRK